MLSIGNPVLPPAAARDDPRPLIVHVLYRLQVGGLENGVVNLVNRMPAAGFRHAIVCLTEATAFRDRIQRDDVEVHEIHKRPGQDPASWRRLYDLFRRLRPRVVHTRNIGCLEAQIPAWLARVPCRVHGEHGWDLSDPDGSNRKYRWLRRLHSPLVHRFVVLSRELERYLVERARIRADKIVRIYNGVDTDRFQPGDRQALPAGFADADSVIFGTVGRMHGVKDQVNLCQAFIRMCDGLGPRGAQMRLVMVGDGPLRTDCRRLLEQAARDRQSWLPGNRDDVPSIMRALDVFVLPSRAEGISNTILEAMACGLPVVATDVGGNGELVAVGQTGALAPAEDPQALAEQMAVYAEDAELRVRQGASGRARVVERFSMQQMVDSYAGLYQRLTERRAVAH